MARNRPLAKEQHGGDLLVRPALGDQGRDAPFSRRQPFRSPPPADLSELSAGPVRPLGCADVLERPERLLDRQACRTLLPRAAPHHAEAEQRPCPAERISGLLVLVDRLAE